MHNYNFDGAGYVHCKYVEVDRNKMIKDINLIYAKMKYTRTLLIIVFASVVQLFYGQERYTISGEFPDHSLDGEYVFLYEHSALVEEPERMKQAFKDTILVVGNTFHYEGTLKRKPFLVSLSCSKGRQFRYNTSFVIEPGDIQLRIVDWGSEGNVSGAPINNDYNAYIIECKKQVDKMLYLMRTKREEEAMKSDARLNALFRDAYIRSTEGRLLFGEKYAQYPDVVRYWLALYIDPTTDSAARESNLSQLLHIVDLMPKADRDILLAWREYRIKLKEYREKAKILRDSLNANEPRFIETMSNSSSITTKNE